MRPSPDEYTCTTACNDTDPCTIVRKRIHRIYLTAPLDAQAGAEVHTGLSPALFHLILWVLYTGMQWKCLPVLHDGHGQPAIHYTTVYRAFAKWADDGSLWQAFLASMRHLATETHLNTRVLHGDGTNTVAKKGAMASGTQATNTRRVRKSSPSRTTTGRCELPSPWRP